LINQIVKLGSRLNAVPDIPQTPVISITVSGTTIVATITGDSDAVHYLKYRGSADTAWQAGGSRSSDGTITLTGLAYNIPYIFICYSAKDGVYSLPAIAIAISLAQASGINAFDAANVDSVDTFLEAMGTERNYLPLNGGSRAIKTIADYGQIQAMPGISQANSGQVTITVANDATKGISTAEFDSGGDMINIPWPYEYSALQNRRITKIISQDSGMVTYEIR